MRGPIKSRVHTSRLNRQLQQAQPARGLCSAMTGAAGGSLSYWSRWTTLSAALLLASGAGTVYAFALFAPLLKSRLRLSQEDTALIASIGALGRKNTSIYRCLWSLGPFRQILCVIPVYTSLLAGLHFDRYGPRRTVLIGAALSGVGFWGLHYAVDTAYTDSALVLGLIYAVAQHGSAWILSASVAAPVRNFPQEYRGTIVGLSKASDLILPQFPLIYPPSAQAILCGA